MYSTGTSALERLSSFYIFQNIRRISKISCAPNQDTYTGRQQAASALDGNRPIFRSVRYEKHKSRPKDLWQAVYDQLEGKEQTQIATRCPFYQYKGSKSSLFLGIETTAQRMISKNPWPFFISHFINIEANLAGQSICTSHLKLSRFLRVSSFLIGW